MPDESAPTSSAPTPEALEAFCDWLRLLELGHPADFEAFCSERAAQAEGLRQLREEYDRVTAILERLSPANSFSARLRERYGETVDPGIELSGDLVSPRGSTGSGQMAQRLSALRPSTQRYEPRGEIARGGMGAILKVWDRELRRMLAMKVVLARRGATDDDSDEQVGERRLSRFLEEAQITAQLDHPGIVPVHDLGIDEKGRVYFTMQLIEGRDLREIFELARLEREGWTRARVLWAMLRVCEAMAYAHSKNVVHRDLKPANIMVGRFGETYVMDWGLAKVLGREDPHDMRLEALADAPPRRDDEDRHVRTYRSEGVDEDDSPLKTMDGDVVGTPAYMSPEQALGRLEEIGPQSDVYSAGAMLYHLLSGHMPYEPLGEKVPTTTILEAVRTGSPWPLLEFDPGLDAELVAICEKAMARDIGRRYGDMMEFAEDLRAYLEDRVVRAYETGVLYEFKKWVRRNTHFAAAIGAIVVLALGSVVLFILQQQKSLDDLAAANVQTERERIVAQNAKEDADAAAERLREETARANAAKQEAVEKRALAEQMVDMATNQARMNRRLSYRAQVLAADYSLKLEDAAAAKANLDATEQDLRGWEWRHLSLATDGSVGELLRLDVGIADLSASADGRRLICLGLDLVSRFIDPDRGVVLSEKNLAGLPTLKGADARRLRIALTPNGGYAVAAALGPTMSAFNTLTGGRMGHFSLEGGRTEIAFSADGLRLIAASDKGLVSVWENATLALPPIAELLGHEGAVMAAALSPRGERALTGGADGTLRLWDVSTGAEIHQLSPDHSREVTAIVWAPPVAGMSDTVAVSYHDGSLAVWDVEQRTLVAVMHGHAAPVGALCFGRDGSFLFSGSDDGNVRRWRVATGESVGVYRGHDREVTGLALVSGGARVASSSLDRTVRVWDASWNPSVTVLERRTPLVAAAFGPGGTDLVACPQRGVARRLDAITGEELDLYLPPPGPDAGAPDGASLAVPALQRAMAASAGGGVVATAGDDRVVHVFDWTSGARLARLDAQRRRLECLALSPDGSRVACGASDGSVRVWTWADSPVPLELEAHRRGVRGLAFSPDGGTLATVGRDRSLRLWDLPTGTQVEVHPEAHSLPIECVAFGPDGQLVATGSADGSLRLWRRDESRPSQEFSAGEGVVTALAFDPSGERLVSGHSSGAVVLWDWDVLGAYRLLSLTGHQRAVTAVGFSPDGSRILSCGSDPLQAGSTLRIWETNPARPRHAARERAAALGRAAQERVEALYDEHLWPEDVRAELAGSQLEPDLGAACERVARGCANDGAWMAERLLRRLAAPELAPEEAARALAEARRLARLDAPGPALRSAHGAAQVRAGLAREGLETLRAAALERPRVGLLDEARDALFRALALSAMGREREAREALAAAREHIGRMDLVSDDELEPMMALDPLARSLQAQLGAWGEGAADGR